MPEVLKRYFTNKSIKNGSLLALLTLIYTLFNIITFETIHRGSFSGFFTWFTESTTSFAITFLFLFLFVAALLFLPSFLFIPLLVLQSVVLFIIAFGSRTKFLLRGEYFTPFDIYVLDEGADIFTFMDDVITTKIIIGSVAVVIALIIFSILFVKLKKRVVFVPRLIVSILSVIGFIYITMNPTLFSSKIYNENIETVESYDKFGFIGAFLTLQEAAENEEPKGNGKTYTKSEINRILGDLETNKTDEVNSELNPNIIVVLGEALWDPLLLENIEFKEDPLPYFRSLMEEHTSGTFLSHSYGGGTFNPELEVLTGLTTRFEVEELYYNRINRPIDSLAHVLKSQGYHTTAVHNFKNWYYGRNEIYKQLGFEKYVSMEFFNNPNYIGPWIDDRRLMEIALDELKQTEGPDFLNVVTVSSHGPYTDHRFENMNEITSSNMTEGSKHILNLYSNLLKETDDAIRLLIEGIEELDEPTVVAIYGDHLPFLGKGYDVYKESGYFNEDFNDYNEYLKMYQTPLLVWDNFKEPKVKEELNMTANFLGSYILAYAGKEMSPIFQMNRLLYLQGMHRIPKTMFYEEVGIKEDDLLDYKLLQYDTLKGRQHLYKNYDVTPVDDYLLGSGKNEITSAEAAKNQQGYYIVELEGSFFVSNGVAYLNGEQLPTEFVSPTKMKATVSADYLNSLKENKIQIKVVDDQGTVISKSNSIKSTVK
ncbi:sulfatase-like hydrolase/transferase [Fredinandcohnia sp. 179-A 10B2 NHS]|uniref:sulfatase-like hydrolase/transferase n=1 Tax=Fredinandcohnia sp. 179-A 10B2 NHS TaxID=3235176 RepID=UPI0039A2FE87